MEALIRSALICPDYKVDYPRITHGKGVYLYDESGKQYLDGMAGMAAVANIGHGVAEMAAVISEQTLQLCVLPTHQFSCRIVEEYLAALTAFAGPAFVKAWTVTSGTEAVENALKLALHYHYLKGADKRYKIISRNVCYHGNSVFMLDVSGIPSRKKIVKKWMFDFPHIPVANVYRKPDDVKEAAYTDGLVNDFEQLLLDNDPDTFAAFVAEPVIGAAMGAVPSPPGYLQKIKKICRKYGLLFIADEVITGFGRTGLRFGMERYEVVPDIIAAGKGISGGYYPLSAVIASREVMQPFMDANVPFLGGHTYACTPVGAAAGQFLLDYLQKESLISHAAAQGDYLKKKLQRLYKYEIVGDIRGEGLLLGIELVADKTTKNPFPPEAAISKKISELALERGLIIYPGRGTVDGLQGHHLLITPPLIINNNQCDEMVDILDECISTINGQYYQQGDFF